MCTMCAPRDKRKSSNSQRKQVELNALRCSRRMCRGWVDLVRQAENLRRLVAEVSIPGMSCYGILSLIAKLRSWLNSERAILWK